MSSTERMRPLLIGIAGGTASGKTSFSRLLLARFLEENSLLIELDSYYRDLSDLTPKERHAVNFDHPSSFDWPLLKDHLRRLLKGESVEVPIYDYAHDNRSATPRRVESRPLILLEGILVFWDSEIRDLMDIKVFVDTDSDVRLMRRIRRDTVERERSLDSILEQYERTVRPMHAEFCEPTKVFADVIIPRGGRNRVALDMVSARLERLLND